MNIIIKRTQSIKHFVEGHLYIDEKLICDTLENSRSCLSSGHLRHTHHEVQAQGDGVQQYCHAAVLWADQGGKWGVWSP